MGFTSERKHTMFNSVGYVYHVRYTELCLQTNCLHQSQRGSSKHPLFLSAYVCVCLPISAYVCVCLPISAYVCVCLPISAYVCVCLPISIYLLFLIAIPHSLLLSVSNACINNRPLQERFFKTSSVWMVVCACLFLCLPLFVSAFLYNIISFSVFFCISQMLAASTVSILREVLQSFSAWLFLSMYLCMCFLFTAFSLSSSICLLMSPYLCTNGVLLSPLFNLVVPLISATTL